MNELIKFLDPNLVLEKHEIIDDVITLYVKSSCVEATCPYCKSSSNKVHSHYARSFQDLPIQGKKTIIILNNRKMFCNNAGCEHTTFAETFDFLQYKAKKTDRLKDEIIRVSLRQSSMSASEYLMNSVANVKKSTICSYLKKMRTKD